MILAEGIALLIRQCFQSKPQRKGFAKFVRILGLVLALSLLIQPMVVAVPRIVRPQLNHFDHVRPAIAHIHTHWQLGDKLYISPAVHHQFRAYQPRFEFPETDVIFGKVKNFNSRNLSPGALQRLSQNIEQLKEGPLKGQERVWFLFGRTPPEGEARILQELDKIVGKPVEIVRYPQAVASLRDLSK